MTTTMTADRERGQHWGIGSFTRSEAEQLRVSLARRMAGKLVSVLNLLLEHGSDDVRRAASGTLVAVRGFAPDCALAVFTHPACAYEVERLVQAFSHAKASGRRVDEASLLTHGFGRLIRGVQASSGETVEWVSDGVEVLPFIGLVLSADVGDRVRIETRGAHISVTSALGSCEFEREQLIGEISTARCRPARDSWVRAMPLFRVGGIGMHIDIVDPAFATQWIPQARFSGASVDAAQESDLTTWTEALSDAAAVVEEITPATASMMGMLVRSLVPVVARDPALACSMSDSALPGAIMTTIDGPAVLAESLVHEFRHNLLHQLEQAYPLYESGSSTEAKFYSPWRNDPRPLHGILHALFVFLDVCAIHAGVQRGSAHDSHARHDSAVRLAGNVQRIEAALQEFRTHARLTEFGVGFVDGIEACWRKFDADVAMLSADARREASEQLTAHRLAWSARG